MRFPAKLNYLILYDNLRKSYTSKFIIIKRKFALKNKKRKRRKEENVNYEVNEWIFFHKNKRNEGRKELHEGEYNK